MYYSISASICERTQQGVVTYQVPTFFLHSSVQGIVSVDHAQQIALDIINPTKRKDIEVFVHAFLSH